MNFSNLLGSGITGIIVAVILSGFLVPFFNSKAKNLANRQDIAKITEEIERIKRLNAERLQCKLNIYVRQLEILSTLYKYFNDLEGYLQRLTSDVLLNGEEKNKYDELVDQTTKLAQDEFIKGRLFLPQDLAKTIDTFFSKTFEVQVNYAISLDLTTRREQAVEFYKNAGIIAYQEIPVLLKTIGEKAQAIINESIKE